VPGTDEHHNRFGEHAEEKVYSRLGQLKKQKVHRPESILGVIGCMAERDTDGILSRTPYVDLICGPGQLNQIPALIREIKETRKKAISLATYQSRRVDPAERSKVQFDTLEALDLSRRPQPGAALLQPYIRIQRGCDKFCTFCVVPFTRGPEQSRSPAAIIEGMERLGFDVTHVYGLTETYGPVTLPEILTLAIPLPLIGEAELIRLNARTGARIWGTQLPDIVPQRRQRRERDVYAHFGPVLAGARLWVASSDGMLRAFDPVDGLLAYETVLGGGAATRPIVVDGVMYVVNADGQLLAFR